MNERVIGVAAVLLALIGLGVVGRQPERTPSPEPEPVLATPAQPEVAERPLAGYTAVASLDGVALSARRGPAPLALEPPASGEPLAPAQGWWGDTDPRALLDSMTEPELVSALTALAPYSEDELDRVPDLREFALELTRIALGEPARDGSRPPESEVPAIDFSPQEGIAADNSTLAPQLAFGPDAGRIYAVFPSEHYGGSQVLVAWRQEGRREPLLVNRYPIGRDDRFSYVWFEPDADWSPGRYRVSVHGPGAQLPKLAEGVYEVQ